MFLFVHYVIEEIVGDSYRMNIKC